MRSGSASELTIVSQVWMAKHTRRAATAAHTLRGSMFSTGRVYSEEAGAYSRGFE